jgi:hypothetical protein
VAGLGAGADEQPIPGIDGRDREDKLRQLVLVEVLGGGVPDVVGHVRLGDERYRLAQLQRRALTLAVERALAPSVQRVQARRALAGGARVLPVHVEAERAAVDLRGADAQQLAQPAGQLDCALEAEHRRVGSRGALAERDPPCRERHASLLWLVVSVK